MEDGEMELYLQELDKARSLNEKLGLGIGLFQVWKTQISYVQIIEKSLSFLAFRVLTYGIDDYFQGGVNLFLNGIVLGTLYYGGYLLSNQRVTPGDLMSFLVATQTIQRSLGQMSLLFGQVIKGSTCFV